MRLTAESWTEDIIKFFWNSNNELWFLSPQAPETIFKCVKLNNFSSHLLFQLRHMHKHSEFVCRLRRSPTSWNTTAIAYSSSSRQIKMFIIYPFYKKEFCCSFRSKKLCVTMLNSVVQTLAFIIATYMASQRRYALLLC